MRLSIVVAAGCLLVAGCIKQTQPSLANQVGTLTSKPEELSLSWTFTIQNEQREVIGSLKVRLMRFLDSIMF